MNYANMIEEKNLKKTFIIATLCSTLVGTFTTSIGLWDRVAEKRRQKHKDTKQDDEIKKLKDQVESAEKKHKEKEEELNKRRDGRDRRDDVYENFDRSGMMIQRQFDEGYGRMGRRFAQGDTITENQLQAQIITLQQTVIQVLQDALYNGRELTRADMAKLISASNSAREGSIDALRQQQNRLAVDSPQSSASSVVSRSRSLSAPRRASTVIESDPLYCRYSLDLQYIPNKPLSASFAPGGDCRCPACPTRVAATADDFWQIGKRTPILLPTADGYEKEVLSTREFTLGQRFVIKCHTADGQYACVLCNRNRDVDAICRTVESLVNHVGRFHDVRELEQERDLREDRGAPLKLLDAPPPPAPLPPLTREVKVEEVRQYVR
ncbi:hypothetical protein BDV96DRAFT_256121 [Lophiotrema nucula]|uniref:Uncharacterized protein n=1 Tax=Lophiotrema nucula TaxID=690887 RepID=A0A6A5YR55_9PLEO|nr:hypothetical protein BDV96DRAFT_256121 [Lophiotrema nucula]